MDEATQPGVTFNRRDFRGGELRFPSIAVQTPGGLHQWITKPMLQTRNRSLES